MPVRFLKTAALVLSLSILSAPVGQAQCPMCKIAAESNLKDGGKAGKGLNAGILYMLALPYLLVGTIGYVWWRNRRKEDGESEPESAQRLDSWS